MNLRGKLTVKYRNLAYQWVDATNGILQVDITRGIPKYEGMWSQCQPGQLRLRSRNTNLDPAKNNQITTFTIIRVEVEGTPIFTGKIFDTNTEYFPKEDSIITIDAFDELGVLSQRKIVNRKCINQTYEAKENVRPINFGDFIQFGDRGYGGSLQNYSPHIIEGYERVIKEYGSRYQWGVSGGIPWLRHLWYSNDQTKYPTPSGNQYDSYDLPPLPAGHRTDSVWQLPDWDGVVISNPTSSAFSGYPDVQIYAANGWGTQNRYTDGTTHCKPTYLMKDGINYRGAYGSSPGIYDTYHPLHNTTGTWNGNWGSTNRTYAPIDNWAALFTTNDNNAYELWLKCEQSEAGFGYVDAYNRFRHFSRAIIDNDNFAQPVKLSFTSDGSSTSYNSIRVTSGAESIIKGVTVNNLWNSNIVEYWKIDAWRDQNIDDVNYVKSTGKNRNGSTTLKLLQPSATTAPIKKYDWLGYSAYESTDSYEDLARTNPAVLSNPIFNTYQRDWDVNSLTTRSYFKGVEGVNGTNQLTLNTNYAWNMGHEYGGFQRMANGNVWDYNATNYIYGRPDNVLDRQKELAQMVLDNYSTASTDIRSISFNVHNDDIDNIKSVDIFDAINITHNESGLSIDKNYAVMGITHTITPDNWDVTYQLWNRDGRP